MFLGMARGRVGSVVFSRRGGEQITRTYNARVANPKTVGQRQQRAIFSTVNRAAKYMRTVVDHSWSGVKSGAESVNYFVKKNVSLLREQYSVGVGAVSLCSKGQEALMPNRYLMSEGSLPTQAVKVWYDEPSGSQGGSLLIGGWAFDDFDAIPATDFFAKTGYKPGDQLSFVAVMGSLDDNGYPVETRFLKRRYIFASTLTPHVIDGRASFADTEQLMDPSSDNLSQAGFAVVNGKLYVCAWLDQGETVLSGCWILSRYDSVAKQWIYSTETMACEPALESNAETAIASYDTEAAAPTSEEFLDGAIAQTEDVIVNDGAELNYWVGLLRESDGEWMDHYEGILSNSNPSRVRLSRTAAASSQRLVVRLTSNRGWMVRAAKMIDQEFPGEPIARNIDTESLVEYNIEWSAAMLNKDFSVTAEAFMIGVGKRGPWLFEIDVMPEE